MAKRVLITGGAGFIGSHLADDLLAHGYRIRALDDLVPQVHGDTERPAYLDPEVELVVGDIRDAVTVRRALQGVDAVFHFAARVGVGQSMYEIAEYTSVNDLGTAVLLEALHDHPVERLVTASSMSVYGEGLYRDRNGRPVVDAARTRAQIEAGQWDPVAPDGVPLEPVSTPETKPPALSSVYALGKYNQERLCLIFGETYNVPTVALRFFNVYGTRQALSNPYTGVLAIFASRLLNARPPLVYEDGRQRRDFVSVRDVASACRLALERDEAAGRVVNVGSGMSVTVTDIARRLGETLGTDIDAEVTGKARAGDIRHCFADISLARQLLGFEPQVELEEGLPELAEWLEGQVATDRVEDAARELAERGLTV
ncbi:MAG: NAD-dependent epimerase/dehydratase family protein [Actinomycetota bacterium]|nr:NAD-dependent epimerase/dehydratase family protein [Actinomycetota bacterium]